MAVDIIINGALGRMGKAIVGVALSDKDVHLVGCIEKPGHPAAGTDIGNHCGLQKTKVPIKTSFKEIPVRRAVVIDFTSPAATRSLLKEIKGQPEQYSFNKKTVITTYLARPGKRHRGILGRRRQHPAGAACNPGTRRARFGGDCDLAQPAGGRS